MYRRADGDVDQSLAGLSELSSSRPASRGISSAGWQSSAVADELPQSFRRNRLRQLAEYKRPWVGRVGLALGLVLWLFVTAVAFGVGIANGLAILIMGGAFILGEVWIERSGGRHPTFATAWRLSLRIAIGIALIVIAAVNSHGWGAVLLTLFGAWLVLQALVLSALWLRETRQEASKR